MKTRSVEPLPNDLNDLHLGHVFPRWIILLYGAACVFLMPWTILLGYLLPPRSIFNHWDIAWVGLDVFEIALFGMTALLLFKKSTWVAIFSTILGTILIADAWFSVLSAKSGRHVYLAFLVAILIQLPLILLSYGVAYKVFKVMQSTH